MEGYRHAGVVENPYQKNKYQYQFIRNTNLYSFFPCRDIYYDIHFYIYIYYDIHRISLWYPPF